MEGNNTWSNDKGEDTDSARRVRRRSSFPPNLQQKTFAQSKFNDAHPESHRVKRLDSEHEYHVATQEKLIQLGSPSATRPPTAVATVPKLQSRKSNRIFPSVGSKSKQKTASAMSGLHHTAFAMAVKKLQSMGSIHILTFRHNDGTSGCCLPDHSISTLRGSVELLKATGSSPQLIINHDQAAKESNFANTNIAFPIAEDGTQSLMTVEKLTVFCKNPLKWSSLRRTGSAFHRTSYVLGLHIKGQLPERATLAAELELVKQERLPKKLLSVMQRVVAMEARFSQPRYTEYFAARIVTKFGVRQHKLCTLIMNYRLLDKTSWEAIVQVCDDDKNVEYELCHPTDATASTVRNSKGELVAKLADQGDPEFNFHSLGHRATLLQLTNHGIASMSREDCMRVYLAAVLATCHS